MKDINGYLEKMEKSMYDKLFFLNLIDLTKYDLIVDFGCANGTMIKNLNNIFPACNYVGYDVNTEMIEKAKMNASSNNILFTNNIDKLHKKIQNKKFIIMFSSVLHELNEQDFEIAIDLMKLSQSVVIRDMFFDKSQNQKIDTSKLLNNNDRYVADFERRYGKIDNLLNLYHYFLKYTYTKNWQTELMENYFSIDYDRIIKSLTENSFEIEYDEKFVLPFKKQEILENFDYELKLPTHRKIIFSKR